MGVSWRSLSRPTAKPLITLGVTAGHYSTHPAHKKKEKKNTYIHKYNCFTRHIQTNNLYMECQRISVVFWRLKKVGPSGHPPAPGGVYLRHEFLGISMKFVARG